jgi:signal transduction histidine kinase/CheY-like chemotaxis protein
VQASSSEYRFLRKFLLLSGVIWLGFGLANTASGYSFGSYQLGAAVLTGILLLLQSSLPHGVVANVGMVACFALLACNAVVTGGTQSPSIWMYTLGPHYGSFTQGRRGAVAYFILSVFFVWLILWLERSYDIPQSFNPSGIRRALVQTVLLALVYYLASAQRLALEEQIALLRSQEVELRKARDLAEQASSARSRFLATMSHEIRTPLNGIIALPDLLRQAENPKAREELIGLLQSSGIHLLGIVNDILDFSKLESTTPTIRMQTFDLEELIESVLQTSSFVPSASSLELVASFDGSGPYTILGDPRRLEQILRNLVSNALKFTRQGGVVVRCQINENRAVVEVIDTGIGISSEDCQRIFEPFRQVSDDFQREFGGTGLGLTISLKIAKTMGGNLSVESEPGKGSKFVLEFPAPRMPSKTKSPQKSPEEGSRGVLHALGFPPDSLNRLTQIVAEFGWTVSTSEGTRQLHYRPTEPGDDSLALPVTRRSVRDWLGESPQPIPALKPVEQFSKHRVLVVDDNQINRKVMKNLLENLGCQVEVAVDGQQALDLLSQHSNFSLVLMDVHMPVMDGIRATTEIRSRGMTFPIVALTADVFPEAKASILEAGANGMQHKPVRADDIVALLKAYPSL